MNLPTILAWALAASLAGNALLGELWLSARDDAAAAQAQRDQARGETQACNASVARLAKAARQRTANAAPKIAAAASQAVDHERRADAELSTPPTVPADACQSAQDRVDRWWQGRATP